MNNFLVKNDNIKQNYINQVDNENLLNSISTNNPDIFKNITDNTEIVDKINNILQEGPLKLGCCLKNNSTNNMQANDTNISYMVPLTEQVADKNEQLKSFKYQRKNLVIPADSCPSEYNTNSNKCNAFIEIYCENLIKEFDKLNLPIDQFKSYCPECACYAPKTEIEKKYNNVPNKCFLQGCSSSGIAYISPNSQDVSCNSAVCKNIIDTNNLSGEKVNINVQVENQCGYYFNDQKNSISDNEIISENITTEQETKSIINIEKKEEPVSIDNNDNNNDNNYKIQDDFYTAITLWIGAIILVLILTIGFNM